MRDAMAIVDLIDLGFRRELGPSGLKMLRRMRQKARRDMWLPPLYDNPNPPPGWVWCENGVIVANLSFRPASPRRSRGWLIGNVVVHPDFRGRGIGRKLMERALKTAQDQHARWVGLEVRADNHPARWLYESLGFRKVGQLHHLIRPPDAPPWRQLPPPRVVRKGRPRDRIHWHNLAQALLSRKQREVLEIRPGKYQFGGWERAFYMWLDGERERTWLAASDPPQWAVRVYADRRARFYEWDLLVHSEAGERGAREAVAQAMRGFRHYAPWPIVIHVTDFPPLLHVLREGGFLPHRILWQMRRDFPVASWEK